MPLLSPAPDLPADEEFDVPQAFFDIEELPFIAENQHGPEASLIYVEGDLALYLDEHDTEQALERVEDRDLALIEALVNLASTRVVAERRRRNRSEAIDASGLFDRIR